METETIRQYTRDYSYIEGLQQACCVRYRLDRRDGVLWLAVGSTSRQLRGVSEERAAELLLFLYENAVGEQMMDAVLEDVCGPLVLPPMGREER